MPYLRRYGRAVLGNAALGDRAVESMLEDLLANLPGRLSKTDLFKLLDEKLARSANGAQSRNNSIQTVSPLPRRALLLTAMEDFSKADAAAILGVDESKLDELLDMAEHELSEMLKGRIFIIEDEPLIAASLSQLVTSMGHSIAGIAVTRRYLSGHCAGPELSTSSLLDISGPFCRNVAGETVRK